MSYVGSNVNIHQPNKECMSCKKWVPVKKHGLELMKEVTVKLNIARKIKEYEND